MKRREFITGLGSAAAWPVVAQAQPAAKVRRVGILTTTGGSVSALWVDAFKRGLAGFGWSDDRSIRFEERSDPDPTAHARELARLSPDAVFVVSSAALRAMRRASDAIPIVFVGVSDPVEQGFVSSLARPGGNITGFANSEFGIATKRLNLLKTLAPSLQRVAFLDDPAQPATVGTWAELEAAAPLLALKAVKVPARDTEEIERVIVAVAREPDSGLLVLNGTTTLRNRELIARLALQHRLPAMYQNRSWVELGGLACYETDGLDMSRRAASYVDRILRGEKPRDLPVQLPANYQLVINLKTAQAIGLTIPETLLATADAVIQ